MTHAAHEQTFFDFLSVGFLLTAFSYIQDISEYIVVFVPK